MFEIKSNASMNTGNERQYFRKISNKDRESLPGSKCTLWMGL